MIALWWLILALVVSCFDIQAWDKKKKFNLLYVWKKLSQIFYIHKKKFDKKEKYIKRKKMFSII